MNFDNMLIKVNNNKYIVIEVIEYENKTYAYLVNNKNQLDAMFKEIIVKNNNAELKDISPEILEKNIYPLFLNKIKNY